MNITEETEFCPKCGSCWKGEPIPEEYRHHYGNKTHFSRLFGLENPERYDGISWWMCPDCKEIWCVR